MGGDEGQAGDHVDKQSFNHSRKPTAPSSHETQETGSAAFNLESPSSSESFDLRPQPCLPLQAHNSFSNPQSPDAFSTPQFSSPSSPSNWGFPSSIAGGPLPFDASMWRGKRAWEEGAYFGSQNWADERKKKLLLDERGETGSGARSVNPFELGSGSSLFGGLWSSSLLSGTQPAARDSPGKSVTVEGPESDADVEPLAPGARTPPAASPESKEPVQSSRPFSYAGVLASGLDWVTAHVGQTPIGSAHVAETTEHVARVAESADKEESPRLSQPAHVVESAHVASLISEGLRGKGATRRLVSQEERTEGGEASEGPDHSSKRLKADVGNEGGGAKATNQEVAKLRTVAFHVVLPEEVAQGQGGFFFEVFAVGSLFTEENGRPLRVPLFVAPYERTLWSSDRVRVRGAGDQSRLRFNFVVARKRGGFQHVFSKAEEERVSRGGYRLQPGRHQFCFAEGLLLERHVAAQLPTNADAALTYAGMLLGELLDGQGLPEVLDELRGLHAQICNAPWFSASVAASIAEGLVDLYDSCEPEAPAPEPQDARARVYLCVAACVIFGRALDLQSRPWRSVSSASAASNRALGGRVMATLQGLADASGDVALTSAVREALRPIPALLVRATAPASDWLRHLPGLAAADAELRFLADVREGAPTDGDQFCADVRAALPFLASCSGDDFPLIVGRVIVSAPCAAALLEVLQMPRVGECEKPIAKHVSRRLAALLQTRGAVGIDRALLHLCQKLAPLAQHPGLIEALRGHVIRSAKGPAEWSPENLQTLSKLVFTKELFAAKKPAVALLRSIAQSGAREPLDLLPGLLSRVLSLDKDSGDNNGTGPAGNGTRDARVLAAAVEAACLAYVSGTIDRATQTPLSAFEKTEELKRQVKQLESEEWGPVVERLSEHAAKLASDFAPSDVLKCAGEGRPETADAFYGVARTAVASFAEDLDKAAAAVRLLTSAREDGSVQVASRQAEELVVHLLDFVRPLCSALGSAAAVYCAELWPLCASAAECDAVKSHPLVKEAGEAVRKASAGMADGTIAVRELRNVLAVPEERIAAAFRAAGCGESHQDLSSLRTALANYERRLDVVGSTLRTFFAPLRPTDLKLYRDDVITKATLFSTGILTLDSIRSAQEWELHRPILDCLPLLTPLADFKTFPNFLKPAESKTFPNFLNPAAADRTVAAAARELLPTAIGAFEERWRAHFEGKDLPLAQVEELWQGVPVAEVEAEFRRAAERNGWPGDCDALALGPAAVRAFLQAARLQELAEELLAVARLFELDGDFFLEAAQRCKQVFADDVAELTLSGLAGALYQLEGVAGDMREDVRDALGELSRGETLVSFLREAGGEDLRLMIDAVEEHSGEIIREATVSDLIEVHQRFMRGLLKSARGKTLGEFLNTVDELLAGSEGGMVAKLHECVENAWGLQRLYRNVANRGELTLEGVAAAMDAGELQLGVDKTRGPECVLSVSYPSARGKTVCSSAEIGDLRSRALLLVNAGALATRPRFDDVSGDVRALLTRFIAQADAAQQLAATAAALAAAGHFEFRSWALTARFADLDLVRTLEGLRGRLSEWKAALAASREEFYELNFCASHQLGPLWDLLTGTAEAEAERHARDLLTWIHPSAEDRALKRTLQKLPTEPGDRLRLLGGALRSAFQGLNRPRRPFGLGGGSAFPADSVSPGEVFVGAVDEPGQVLTAVMSLYLDQGQLPQPSDVLLCDARTSWEEAHLLLLRCFRFRWTGSADDPLFCVAFADQLDFTCHTLLAQELQKAAKTTDVSRFKLAIIVSGDRKRQSFGVPVRSMVGKLTSEELKPLLGAVPDLPEVVVVTSDRPGVGKTETIRQLAAQKGASLHCLSVTGAASRTQIIARLQALGPGATGCLHADVSTLDDPAHVSNALFELLILGSLSCTTAGVYRAGFRSVFVELANDMRNRLFEDLPICHWFRREHLTWDLTNLRVSDDVSSPVRTVCVYLHALESGRVDRDDLILSGACRDAAPLPADTCQDLLQRHFLAHVAAPSFSLLNTFLNVLAAQLGHLSDSVFFKSGVLADMGAPRNVRSLLVQSLVAVARDFALRAVRPSGTAAASAASGGTAERLATRVQDMIQWRQSNHLLVIFHSQDPNTVTALYRDVTQVPLEIQRLFNSQTFGQARLPDYRTLPIDELHERLERVVRTRHGELNLPPYALTADNLLKMTLISLRIRARVPVVIMGETGCGKTSLISYLARVVEVPFRCLNIHAGTTEEDILEFVGDCCEAAAAGGEVWGLLDEVNTCQHLGLLNDLVCHRSLDGISLPVNLTLLATCNPYRLRGEPSQAPAGLANQRVKDDQSRLVYRVNELPEAMLDWTWDYGSLNPADERLYISKMVSGRFERSVPLGRSELLVDLLATSQAYVRTEEKDSCVSLRDVSRWLTLQRWFSQSLTDRPPSEKKRRRVRKAESVLGAVGSVVRKVLNADRGNEPGAQIELRSVVLALAHCYYCRLPSDEQRRRFRELVRGTFARHGVTLGEGEFEDILRGEQMDYLDRMALPPGTAKNAALRENVFVTLVCVLTRIPVFMIGKPGCSKSLCMQLINSNLRGPDSSDPFFQKLPQVYVMSYQGSESSTSEGIRKVFEKARAYKARNKSEDVLPVVLLDEVGLAEVSRHNPLKVLHSILDPPGAAPGALLDVAVVGISNWELDPAKMNRAIHLSRPEPTVTDLYETARSILEAYLETSGEALSAPFDAQLRALARAYHGYEARQPRPHFHGLRDFYSLIKCLRGRVQGPLTPADIVAALGRNFGGNLDPGEESVEQIFLREQGLGGPVGDPPGVLELVGENLRDEQARHLMIITNGDAGLGILEQFVGVAGAVKLFGSAYAEDQSEEYSYRVLSKIISCMEIGSTLILKGMEPVYGSLYDMLNQNYSIVGTKRNCRVALGAFSSPMCHVSPRFRCIVLVDERALAQCDPPFLNRFEKHHLTYQRVLTPALTAAVAELHNWAVGMATAYAPGGELAPFDENDVFCGLHGDTLPSLVLHHSAERGTEGVETVLERCKRDLVRIATADGMLRSLDSALSKMDPAEAQRWFSTYFDEQSHGDLPAYLTAELADVPPEGQSGLRAIVMTYSSVHTDVRAILESRFDVQVEQLSAFTAERHLAARVDHFWTSDAALLVLQGEARADRAHIQLAKFLVDEHAAARSATAPAAAAQKHVVLVIHMERAAKTGAQGFRGFSFLCGWRQAAVDCLEPSENSVRALCRGSLVDLLQSPGCPFASVARRKLYEAFLCIKYDNTNASAAHVRTMVASVSGDADLLRALGARAVDWLRANGDAIGWQRHVACSQRALLTSPSLREALLKRVEDSVHRPLAMLLCALERNGALAGYFHAPPEVKAAWLDLILDERALNLETLPEPRGLECYALPPRLPLALPFSGLYCKAVEELRTLYESERTQDADGPVSGPRATDPGKLLVAVANSVPGTLARVVEDYFPQYVLDFVCLQAPPVDGLSPEQARQAFLWLLEQSAEIPGHPVALHAACWELETAIAERLNLLGACNRALSFQELLGKWDGTRRREQPLESLDAFLLGAFSEALLPDERVLARLGGLEAWLAAASRVLRRIAAMGAARGRALEGWRALLTLMRDFISVVALPFEGEETRAALRELLQIARTRGADLLTQAEGLDQIQHVLTRLRESVTAGTRFEDSVDRFWALVLGASLSDKRTSPLVARFICKAGRFNRFLKPVLERLLTVAGEKVDLPGTLLLDDGGSAVPLCLKVLEDALREQRTWTDDVDGPLEALVCDVMQGALFGSLGPEAVLVAKEVGGDVATSEADGWKVGRLIPLLTSAGRLFRAGADAHGILRHLCAAAFLRALLGAFAAAAAHTRDRDAWTVDVEQLEERVVTALGRELPAGAPGTDALLVFILKTLRQRFSLQSVGEIIERLGDKVPSDSFQETLRSLSWRSAAGAEKALGFDPFQPRSEDVSAVFDRVSASLELAAARNNAEDVNALVKESAADPSIQLGLLYGVASSLYVQRAAGDLGRPRERAAAALKSAVRRGDLPGSVARGLVALADNAFSTGRDSVLFMRPDGDASGQHLAAACAHLALVLAPNPRVQTPFDQYAKRPAAAAAHFFVAGAADMEAVAGNLLRRREALTSYRCACGALFFVGNCGAINDIAQCPDCRNQIGRGYHEAFNPGGGLQRLDGQPTMAAGGERTERPGYLQETPESVSSLSHTVRNLSPVAFRMLHFLTHSALLVGSELGFHSPGELSGLVLGNRSAEDDGKARDLVQRHVCNDWRLLRQQLACDVQQASAVVHSVLSSLGEAISGTADSGLSELPGQLTVPGSVEVWETAFADEFVRPVTQDTRPQSVLAALTRDKGTEESSAGIRSRALKMEIEETEFAMTNEYRAEWRPRLLRTRGRPSFSHFQATFLLDAKNNDRYPFLRAFLEQEDQLELVKELFPLVEWSNQVLTRFGNQVDRREAERTSVEQALERLGQRPLLRSQFQRFTAAWDALRSEPLRWQCKDLPPPPPMDPSQPLAFSCVETREPGVFLCAMIHALAQRQNALLGAAADAAARGCAALRDLQYGTGAERAGKLPEVALQDVQPHQVINYVRDESLYERHSCCHPDFGRGQEVLYDFGGIEAELAGALVAGKALLQTDNIREFPYRLELFRHVSATLLSDVAQKIPQETFSPERARAFRALAAARRDTAALLGAFGVALSMLKKTGGDPNQSLVEYAQQWLPDYAIRHFEEPFLGGFQLRHVAALYETLEECVADVILASSDGLDAAAYRAPLPPDVRRELLASTDLHGGPLSADVFAHALKRFAVRFLTSERCGPDVQASLYLADADFMTWPDGAVTVPDVSLEDAFPERLLVEHVAQAYEVLQEHISLAKQGRTMPLDEELVSESNSVAKLADQPSTSKESQSKTGWLGIFERLYG